MAVPSSSSSQYAQIIQSLYKLMDTLNIHFVRVSLSTWKTSGVEYQTCTFENVSEMRVLSHRNGTNRFRGETKVLYDPLSWLRTWAWPHFLISSWFLFLLFWMAQALAYLPHWLCCKLTLLSSLSLSFLCQGQRGTVTLEDSWSFLTKLNIVLLCHHLIRLIGNIQMSWNLTLTHKTCI